MHIHNGTAWIIIIIVLVLELEDVSDGILKLNATVFCIQIHTGYPGCPGAVILLMQKTLFSEKSDSHRISSA
jgi:hypothetical protein